MLKSVFLRYFLFAAFPCLCAVTVGAQEPEMPPPSTPEVAPAPPPDPNLSPPIPPLDWEPLPPSPPAEEPSAAPLPAALFVPPPPPDHEAPPPPAPPAVAFRSDPPSAAEIDRVIPRLEVWRASSNLPQKPKGRFQKSRRLAHASLARDEPVVVRLRFHPLSQGKPVVVRAARGLTLNPPDEVLVVPADGQILVSVRLDPRMNQSHVSFSCEGLMTSLVLARTSPDIVAAIENAAVEDEQ